MQVLKKLRDRNRDLETLEKIFLCRKIPRRQDNVFIEIFLLILNKGETDFSQERKNASMHLGEPECKLTYSAHLLDLTQIE